MLLSRQCKTKSYRFSLAKYIFLTFGIVLLHQQNQVTIESGKDVNFFEQLFCFYPLVLVVWKTLGEKFKLSQNWHICGNAARNRPLYLLLSGFARGQALGCHAVARADRMQKSMQKHCRYTENDQSVVLNRRLPVSTFSPNHWSWRCHLLAPHWAEIDRLASEAERAREIKEKSSLPSQTLVLPLQLPSQSEGETSSRRACGSRKADRGTQEAWGRNGASTCLLECENASSEVALSHTVFWKREMKGRLAEAFISGLTLSVVQWEALWKALGIELKEKILSQMCAANEERGRKNVRGAGRLAVVTLKDQLLVMTRLKIRLGWLQQELAYIFGVSEACVSLTFQEVD